MNRPCAGLAAGVLVTGWLLAGQADILSPDLRLARIKAHVGQSLQGLPNYTCLETVERFERRGATAPLVMVDRLRLEVALVDKKEYFAWPGESKFEEKAISGMIPFGTIGNGNFALHAYNVFLSSGPAYSFAGETAHQGRRILRYDYRVPGPSSGYTLLVPGRQARVGYHGVFLVDAETLDLVRLEVIADDIPPELGLVAAADTMEYASIRLGEAEFLLPARSELMLRNSSNVESRNRTEFSRCRQFTGQSSIRFDQDPAVSSTRAEPAAEEVGLPAGARLDLVLETAIDSAKSAVGDSVGARLERDVKRNGAVVIPKGALLTGRITRLERTGVPTPYYEVRLHFRALEFGKKRADFTARLEAVVTRAGTSTYQTGVARLPNASRQNTFIRVEGVEQAPGIAGLVITGARAELPRGLRMVWRVAPSGEEP